MGRHGACTLTLRTMFLPRLDCPRGPLLILAQNSLISCLSSCSFHIRTRPQVRHLDHCVSIVQSDTLERRTRVEDIVLENQKALADASGKIAAATVAALPGCPVAAAASSVRVVNAPPPLCYFPTLRLLIALGKE